MGILELNGSPAESIALSFCMFKLEFVMLQFLFFCNSLLMIILFGSFLGLASLLG